MLTLAWLALLPAAATSETAAASETAAPAETAEDRIVEALGSKEDFLWGTATSAYQYEGAWNKDGRQKSIWDTFAQEAGHTHNNENGNIANNFYRHYENDIHLLKGYGFNAFRFSISWTRVFTKGPNGTRQENPKGVKFYKNVIESLTAKNITPIVTMYHWDLPADLDWLNSSVVDAFAEYADFVFFTFPEVRHWITVNEPWTFCYLGYGLGLQAPGVKSEYEKYRCGHNALLAHARAVDIYRKKYQNASNGQISAALNYDFAFPRNPSDPQDHQATQLCHDFNLGWFADPIYLTGDYPESMRQRLGDNLPRFTEEEKALLNGSYDGFYGLNLYAGQYAFVNNQNQNGFGTTFMGLDGKMIGEASDPGWLFVVPRALRAVLEYVHDRYKVPSILITENGCVVPGEEESNFELEKSLKDTFRVNYYRDYLENVALAASSSKVPVVGYFIWSLMDNFEWAYGYNRRFGITYVDYVTEQRYPRASAKWFTALFERIKPQNTIKRSSNVTESKDYSNASQSNQISNVTQSKEISNVTHSNQSSKSEEISNVTQSNHSSNATKSEENRKATLSNQSGNATHSNESSNSTQSKNISKATQSKRSSNAIQANQNSNATRSRRVLGGAHRIDDIREGFRKFIESISRSISKYTNSPLTLSQSWWYGPILIVFFAFLMAFSTVVAFIALARFQGRRQYSSVSMGSCSTRPLGQYDQD